MKTLSLKDADFHLSRNASLNSDIKSDNSHITLGSDRVFVDKNDGTGNYVILEEGTSVPDTVNDRSQYEGNITLDHNSTPISAAGSPEGLKLMTVPSVSPLRTSC